MQELFIRELAATFQATRDRIAGRMATTQPSEFNAIIEDELRGLYHGLFVMFDGGTALADDGLISIVDENGVVFDRFMHELCFNYWPAKPT